MISKTTREVNETLLCVVRIPEHGLFFWVVLQDSVTDVLGKAELFMTSVTDGVNVKTSNPRTVIECGKSSRQ